MSITFVLDATHRNIGSIPAGTLAALYTTGTADIKATPGDFSKHPNAIRICQDHGSDDTADFIDMETGAATPTQAAAWLTNARHSFNTNKRPGQRWPGIYLSRSRVTEQANVLVNSHDTNVPLWIANWGESQNVAIGEIVSATGPFPIVALQIRNQIVDDFSVFSTEHLNRRSGMATPTKPVNPEMPPGPWNNAHAWDWKQVVIAGIGLDGKLHMFEYDPKDKVWTKVL